MTLSATQLRAAATGEVVRFTEGGVEFVVVRSDDFERLKTIRDADYLELRLMLARSAEGNGWDEPGMEAYDAYPSNP